MVKRLWLIRFLGLRGRDAKSAVREMPVELGAVDSMCIRTFCVFCPPEFNFYPFRVGVALGVIHKERSTKFLKF